MSSSSGNVPRGLGRSDSAGNLNATALAVDSATPQTLPASQGPNTITWKLTGGLKWGATGIHINGGWTFGQPSLQGNSYVLTYTNDASTTHVFPYSVDVSNDDGTVGHGGSTGGNDPVIENQGGGGSGHPGPDRSHRFDPKSD